MLGKEDELCCNIAVPKLILAVVDVDVVDVDVVDADVDGVVVVDGDSSDGETRDIADDVGGAGN